MTLNKYLLKKEDFYPSEVLKSLEQEDVIDQLIKLLQSEKYTNEVLRDSAYVNNLTHLISHLMLIRELNKMQDNGSSTDRYSKKLNKLYDYFEKSPIYSSAR